MTVLTVLLEDRVTLSVVQRALNHEHLGLPTFWTHVIGRGYILPVIALAVVLFSPQPVMHTVGLVVGVTVVFQLSTGEWRESDWHFPVLAAATLVGCAAALAADGERLTRERIEAALQRKAMRYDKAGEEHYNLISAYHKALRGSDPNGALYWLAWLSVSRRIPVRTGALEARIRAHVDLREDLIVRCARVDRGDGGEG